VHVKLIRRNVVAQSIAQKSSAGHSVYLFYEKTTGTAHFHENFVDLTSKAQQLLEAGHSVKTSVKLTRREEEVLDGILRSLANKEIAGELNLSERTVKFHVSSLLAKFKVRSRMELMREASQQAMRPPLPSAIGNPAATVHPFADNHAVVRGKVLPLARRMMA
jgi:DNA-binding NarL/FixJ family response regulator